MKDLAIGRLRVARIEGFDVRVTSRGRLLHVVQHVVDAQTRIDGPNVGVPEGDERGGRAEERADSVCVSFLWFVVCGSWLVGDIGSVRLSWRDREGEAFYPRAMYATMPEACAGAVPSRQGPRH